MESFVERLAKLWRPPAGQNTNLGPALWSGKIGNVQLAFHPSQFYIHGVILAVVAVYILLGQIGRWRQRRHVAAWSEVYGRALQREFAQVGADALSAAPKLLWNGSDEACLFATGRRGVATLHATAHMRPWHDPVRVLIAVLYDMFLLPESPMLGDDTLVLTFTLPEAPRVNGGTFALIDKAKLRALRHDRYDIKFARVAEGAGASEARGLSERFAIASEAGHITDRWLGEVGPKGKTQRERLGVAETLNGAAGAFLQSLVFSDQPHQQPVQAPTEAERVETLELTLRLPTTRAAAQASVPLLTLGLDLVDALHLTASGKSDILGLRPDTQQAIKKTRAEVAAALTDALLQETRAEAGDAAEEERRKAQQAKLEKLSPAELAKRKELAKKRAQRKAQMTTVKRGRS